MELNIDRPLYNDFWVDKFTYFTIGEKVRLAQVSKTMKNIIHHPLSWPVFEYSFIPENEKMVIKRQTSEAELKQMINNFAKYITSYCTRLVDLSLELPYLDSEMLDSFFQIKTLKRMVIFSMYTGRGEGGLMFNPKSIAYIPKQPPACRDLQFLRLEAPIMSYDDCLDTMLSGLPDLEELHISVVSAKANKETFAHSKKLRILTSGMFYVNPVYIINWCPSLKYLLYYDPRATKDILAINKTTVICERAFDNLDSLDKVKFLAPLLSPYTKNGALLITSLVVRKDHVKKEVLTYLVKDLKFDLNVMPKTSFYEQFRPGFNSPAVENASHYIDGVSENVLNKRPIEAALMLPATSSNMALSWLLELGAKAEFEHEARSLLEIAHSARDKIRLLQHGANPNKIGEDGVPAYMKLFGKEHEDSADVIKELAKHKWDFNRVHGGKTVLDIARANKKNAAVKELLACGAQPAK